jgi:hypothetical protein
VKRKYVYLAGAGVVLWLLLRRKAAAAATTSSTLGGFSPIGFAEIYFDPGQTFDINANVNSSDFGRTIGG